MLNETDQNKSNAGVKDAGFGSNTNPFFDSYNHSANTNPSYQSLPSGNLDTVNNLRFPIIYTKPNSSQTSNNTPAATTHK